MPRHKIKINGVKFYNNIVVSPMCQYSSQNGCPTEWHYHHLRNLIETGAGSLIIESTAVSKIGRITNNDMCLYNIRHLNAHSKLIKYLKKIRNIPIIIQLSHSGRKGSAEIPFYKKNIPLKGKHAWKTFGPSNISRDANWPKPLEMKISDIKKVIKQFEYSSCLAFKAGYDGVEIHMAHGYLLHQFCSPISNKRSDVYGLNDSKYEVHKKIIRSIKNILPKKKLIGARVTGDDHLPKGIKTKDCINLLDILKKEGLNYACISSGGIIPKTNMEFCPGYRLKMSNYIKKNSKVLIRTSGLINNHKILKKADKLLDLIAIGRKLVNDKYFLIKDKKYKNLVVTPKQYKYCID